MRAFVASQIMAITTLKRAIISVNTKNKYSGVVYIPGDRTSGSYFDPLEIYRVTLSQSPSLAVIRVYKVVVIRIKKVVIRVNKLVIRVNTNSHWSVESYVPNPKYESRVSITSLLATATAS